MDGEGFDFAYDLSIKHRFLFCLVIFYSCITTFGILNGLVGIFGTIFAVAANDTFAAPDDDDSDMEQEDMLFSKLEADNEDSTLDEEARKSNNNNNNGSNNNINNNNGTNNNDDDNDFISPNLNSKLEGEVENSQAQKRVHFINIMKSETGASKFALKELFKKEIEREIEREKEIEEAAEKMATSIDLELSNSSNSNNNNNEEEDGAVARSTSDDNNTTEQPHKHNINNYHSNNINNSNTNSKSKTLRTFVGKHLMNGRHRNAYIVPEAHHNNLNADQSHISPRNSDSPSHSPPSSPLQKSSNASSFVSMSSLSPSKPKRHAGTLSSSPVAAMMQRASSMRKTKSSIQMDNSGGMFAAIALQAVETGRKKKNRFKATTATGDNSSSFLDSRISGLEDKINDQSIMISSLLSQIELLNEGLRRYQPNLFRNSLNLPIRESEDEDEEEEEDVHSIGSINLLDSAKVQDF